MRDYCYILTLAILLSGCSILDPYRAPVKLGQEAIDFCTNKYDPDILGNNVFRAECIRFKLLEISRRYSYPSEDVTELSTSFRIALAKKIDLGLIDHKQAKMKMASIGYILDAEEYNRIYATDFSPTPICKLIQQVNALNSGIECKQLQEAIACS